MNGTGVLSNCSSEAADNAAAAAVVWVKSNNESIMRSSCRLGVD